MSHYECLSVIESLRVSIYHYESLQVSIYHYESLRLYICYYESLSVSLTSTGNSSRALVSVILALLERSKK